MPNYKLNYFNLKGRAEFIRFIFYQAGADFEDHRIERENFGAECKAKCPFGQLPTLEVDGKLLSQSVAIGRFIAREHGLAGSNNCESARMDMYVDGVQDAQNAGRAVAMALMSGDEEKTKAATEEYKKTTFGPFLDRYEAFLKKNGTGFLVGDKLSWADIVLAEFLDRMGSIAGGDGVLAGHACLKKLKDTVFGQPAIKKYVQGRPDTKF